jgi:UDP-glucose 4-epimerase
MAPWIVIGGTGFIGSAIVRAGRPFAPVTSWGSRECNLLDAAACAEKLHSQGAGSILVYAGGIPRLKGDGIETLCANLTMIEHLLAAADACRPAKLIVLSSADVYGSPASLPITESTEIRPTTRYGAGKAAVELMVRAWHDRTRVPAAILRLPGVYGPGDRGLGFPGAVYQCIAQQREFRLTGNPATRRDYVFVEDVGAVVRELAETDFEELTLNLATGDSWTLEQILDCLFELHGTCPLRSKPAAGVAQDLKFDIGRLRQTLPSLQLTPISAGLARYGTPIMESSDSES